MSVYKRKDAATYSYDFQHRGRRFSGDTGEVEKRKARAVETLKREEAKQLAAEQDRLNAPQTWREASSRWYTEVGQHHKNQELTLLSLAWLEREIGGTTPLMAITDNTMARIVAKRRTELRKVGRKDSPKRPVSNATVNRMVTEQVRKVLSRAREIWKVPVPDIDWSAHMLDEPQERVREASRSEERAVFAQLERGYDDAVRFTLLSGCRRGEVVPRSLKETEDRYMGLVWTRVDFFGRSIAVVGKGGKTRAIPMSDAMYDLLWSIRHSDSDHVFTYVAKRTDKRKKIERGKRYPITEAGLRTAFRRAVASAGVKNLRFHDLRHTTATRTLRKSNLRVVQLLLGHSDVATTTKYAHAQSEDIRAALNAVSPTKSPATHTSEDGKMLGDQEKQA